MTPIYRVDVFTDVAFRGNPAVVCLLDAPRTVSWMQSVAAEMNASETAFVHDGDGSRGLRWFTATDEVALCGHGTLATAHVLWTTGQASEDELRFATRSGLLCARRSDGDGVALDLPAAPPTALPLSDPVVNALGVDAIRAARSTFDVIEVASADDVRRAAPDFAALSALRRAAIVTALDGDEVVCRVFVPAWGKDEDPATGSAQCVLGPYWSDRLGPAFKVRQLSTRGGAMHVRVDGDRVTVAGRAVTTVEGRLLA